MPGSFGVVLKITVSTTLTAVTRLLDAQFPKQVKELADNTGHDTSGGYRTRIATGLRDLQKITCKLEWDIDEATHAAVLAAFASDEAVNMSIEDPAGDEVIAFAAHIEAIGRVAPLSGVYSADVEISPTGAPTIS